MFGHELSSEYGKKRTLENLIRPFRRDSVTFVCDIRHSWTDRLCKTEYCVRQVLLSLQVKLRSI